MLWALHGKPHDKFTPKGKLGFFFGYPHGLKGYCIYDFDTKVIYSSRDVHFFENISPYSSRSRNILDLQAHNTCFGYANFVDYEIQAAAM